MVVDLARCLDPMQPCQVRTYNEYGVECDFVYKRYSEAIRWARMHHTNCRNLVQLEGEQGPRMSGNPTPPPFTARW